MLLSSKGIFRNNHLIFVNIAGAAITGILIGMYAVYTVVFIYKFKGKPKAAMVRVLGVSSVAIVASIGNYFVTHVLTTKEELDLPVSIAFTASGLVSLIIFFWIKRKNIG